MRIVIIGCLLLAIPGCTVQAPPPPPEAWGPVPPPPPSRYEDQPADRTDRLKELLECRHAAANSAAVRHGSRVTPKQTKRVNPVYPPEALAQRVQRVVILEVCIGVDGKVTEARVLRSVPLLDKAAIDAVRQWEYAPTQLNGVTTAVIMTVTVAFSLDTTTSN